MSTRNGTSGSRHCRMSLTATGDNFTNRSAPPGSDQSSKGQPEAVKDNPLRAPEAQRPPSITLRKEHSSIGIGAVPDLLKLRSLDVTAGMFR